MIDVLVVEDSMVARDLLVYILKSDMGIRVIGTVSNGKEALDFLRNNRPDVITMDINMPIMNGIEATKRIMETTPIPIVIISSYWDPKEVDDSFKALQIGAVSIAEKPTGYDNARFQEIAKSIIQNVKLMSEIKVVKRRNNSLRNTRTFIDESLNKNENNRIKLIGIGCSTGGPVVLENILSSIRSDLKLPIVVVQHILPGFVEGFVEWLNRTSKIPVKVASNGEVIKNGICYIAPDEYHLEVNYDFKIVLAKESTRSKIKPSVSHFFNSLTKTVGNGTVAILLTGMGRDGAAEMKDLLNAGAITIAQDKESCIVHGMPGEAIKLKGVKYIMNPYEIIGFINNI